MQALDDGLHSVHRLDYVIGFDLDDSRRTEEFAQRLRAGFEAQERPRSD